MCLRPRFIYVSQDKTAEWKKRAYRYAINSTANPELIKMVEPYQFNKVSVPCGTCSECLRQRQNDLAARVAMAANDYDSMHFVTLTYDEEFVPLSARKAFVNEDTGEVILDSVPIPLIRPSNYDLKPFPWQTVFCLHEKIERMKISHEPRVILEPYALTCDVRKWREYYYITPSLHRRDVRLWFKSARIAYERNFGKKLSDFKYVIAGEMGPRTCRPHYHILLLGLKTFEVDFLVKRWKFGFTNVKSVPKLNADGTNGFVLAAKYVSKYISKGNFECSTVKDGLSEKPRICLSRFIGTTIPDDVVNELRCYDLFGKYDLDSLIIENTKHLECPERLSISQIAMILSEYRKRAIRRYGLRSWTTLPKCIFKKVFSVSHFFYDFKYEKTIEKTRRSVIQMAFGSFMESDFLLDFVTKLRSLEGISDKEIASQVSCSISGQQASAEISDLSGQKNLRSFYAKSIF